MKSGYPRNNESVRIHIVKTKTTPMAMIVRNAMKGSALTILSCVEIFPCMVLRIVFMYKADAIQSYPSRLSVICLI